MKVGQKIVFVQKAPTMDGDQHVWQMEGEITSVGEQEFEWKAIRQIGGNGPAEHAPNGVGGINLRHVDFLVSIGRLTFLD